eukprot:TRINITY_DN112441_c0_g1_i1.p1 TRINITY_DN112441_c0_g1~~TRINITY_DN112441_c0_g1_i1.p1  ORF type:complete len:200 (+),score=0.21 TRINITY_DN112441_c0_g1_i1:94-693(+)
MASHHATTLNEIVVEMKMIPPLDPTVPKPTAAKNRIHQLAHFCGVYMCLFPMGCTGIISTVLALVCLALPFLLVGLMFGDLARVWRYTEPGYCELLGGPIEIKSCDSDWGCSVVEHEYTVIVKTKQNRVITWGATASRRWMGWPEDQPVLPCWWKPAQGKAKAVQRVILSQFEWVGAMVVFACLLLCCGLCAGACKLFC